MKPGIIAGIVVVILIAVGVFVFIKSDDSVDTITVVEPQPVVVADAPEETPAEEELALTVEEVAKHNNANDCWTIINDNVYDITSYIPFHPGGDEILRACGGDGTSLFETRTTEDGETVGSGTPHSPRAETQLNSFLLGPLVV